MAMMRASIGMAIERPLGIATGDDSGAEAAFTGKASAGFRIIGGRANMAQMSYPVNGDVSGGPRRPR